MANLRLCSNRWPCFSLSNNQQELFTGVWVLLVSFLVPGSQNLAHVHKAIRPQHSFQRCTKAKDLARSTHPFHTYCMHVICDVIEYQWTTLLQPQEEYLLFRMVDIGRCWIVGSTFFLTLSAWAWGCRRLKQLFLCPHGHLTAFRLSPNSFPALVLESWVGSLMLMIVVCLLCGNFAMTLLVETSMILMYGIVGYNAVTGTIYLRLVFL